MGTPPRPRRPDSTTPVTDLVGWTVQRRPLELTSGAWLAWGVGLALGFATNGSVAPDRPSTQPHVPADPTALIPFPDAIKIRGTAPWLPKPALGEQDISVSSTSAWLEPGWGHPEPEIPLEQLTILSSSCRDHYRRRRRPGARWTLEVGGEDAHATITGSWLSLAWLGHLGGWPEPRSVDGGQGGHRATGQ